jgi:hypothetical protein
MPISRITGASIEDGSIVIADLGITTFNTGTGNTLTLQANSATGLVIDVTGNTAIANSLSFSAAGARIRGDFSNATLANRTLVQTSTANSSTSLSVIPNGTSVISGLFAYNNSDPTNASTLGLLALSTEARLSSSITGTGTYQPLTMHTSNAERLRIDTSGNMMLGVTTVSSSTKFDVYGNSSAAHIGARVTNAATDGYSTLWLSSSNDGLVRGGSTAGAFTSELAMLTSGSTPLTFYTGNTKRMTVGATGNIGINTTSPSQLLHGAAGTILASNTSTNSASVAIAGNGSTVGTSAFELIQGSSSEAYVYNRANSYLVLGTNNTERMRITSTGRVGIGVNPSALLDVGGTGSGSADNWILLRAGNTGGAAFPGLSAGLAVGNNFSNGFSDTNLVWGQAIASHQYFSISKWTGSSVAEQIRITSAGQVGINGSPTNTLQVSEPSNLDANFYLTATAASRAAIITLNGTVAGYDWLYSTTNGVQNWRVGGGATSATLTFCTGSSGTERMRIDASGSVQLSTAGTSILNSSGRPILRQSGSILQVVTNFPTSGAFYSQAVGSYAEITTAYRTSITPVSTNSILILEWVGLVGGNASGNISTMKFYDVTNNTDVGLSGISLGSRGIGHGSFRQMDGDNNDRDNFTMRVIVPNSSTTARTYSIYHYAENSQTKFFNATSTDNNGCSYVKWHFTITEIAA